MMSLRVAFGGRISCARRPVGAYLQLGLLVPGKCVEMWGRCTREREGQLFVGALCFLENLILINCGVNWMYFVMCNEEA